MSHTKQTEATPVVVWETPKEENVAKSNTSTVISFPTTKKETSHEATTVTWAVGNREQPVKLIMVSSGFRTTRREGNSGDIYCLVA